jgi:hypothetical protein
MTCPVSEVAAIDDSQYDYGNPYLTLDPKTGELVEVDGRKDAAKQNTAQQSTASSNQNLLAAEGDRSWLLPAVGVGGALLAIAFVAWLRRSRRAAGRTERIVF